MRDRPNSSWLQVCDQDSLMEFGLDQLPTGLRPGSSRFELSRHVEIARTCSNLVARCTTRGHPRFTDVSRTITFPDRRFPDKMFPGRVVSRTRPFPDNHFPGQDVSRTRRFPDNHFPGQTFPGQTFPGQVILRNFHVHSVCKYQLYRPSHNNAGVPM